jgi:hypothetical protein
LSNVFVSQTCFSHKNEAHQSGFSLRKRMSCA